MRLKPHQPAKSNTVPAWMSSALRVTMMTAEITYRLVVDIQQINQLDIEENKIRDIAECKNGFNKKKSLQKK